MSAHAIHGASAQAARIGQTRDGVVIAVDPTAHAVRVRLEPDGKETGWLPDAGMAAGGMRIGCPSEIGTQVKVLPTDGDIEHALVVARLFDTVVTPPVSPVTGKQAQPGEMLVMAGQGAGPAMDGGTVGAATAGAGWYHVTPQGIFIGGSDVTCIASSIALTAPGVTTSGNAVVGTGATGSFTSLDGKVVTVRDGIITNIY